MSELTAQELRKLPKKDTWTDDEALALYTTTEGIETCCGSPTPFYVQTRADRVRWSHCVRGASVMWDEPACNQGPGQTARFMYTDREQYT
jgi:hypothetical protein